MTFWLKQRLGAVFIIAALAGGVTFLRAQDDYPAPAKTPEEAGAQFFRLLNFIHNRTDAFGVDETQNSAVNSAAYEEDAASVPVNGSISRAQFEAFNTSSFNSSSTRLKELMKLLYQKIHEPQYSARVAGTEGNQTIVEVAPAAQPKAREVVVIAEDGGYRVDLKATYGQWVGRSGTQLDEDWYRYTGVVSPSLRQNPTFLRSQCQSQLKQQMLGLLMYSQDYDERMPPAREWIDVLQPYVKSEQIFRCPSLASGGNGYAYNQNLSRFPAWKLADVATLINIYETSNPKRNWFGPGTGRAYRHLDGWNLAFVDGHVKWFKSGGPVNAQFKPQIDPRAKPPFWTAVTPLVP